MRPQSLQDLQTRIHSAISQDQPLGKSFLVFKAAGSLWAVDFVEVSTVMTCGHITRLWASYGMPKSVVGISSAGEDILTVIDAGLVLSSLTSSMTLKSRLITFTAPQLRGVALQVDRVFDPVEHDGLGSLGEPVVLLDSNTLSQKINLGVSP